MIEKELLERALTAWYQDWKSKNGKNRPFEEELHEVFANEFPQLSFKVIGDKVVIL